MEKEEVAASGYEDLLPVMADKLDVETFVAELCRGFQLLADPITAVITASSLQKNSGILDMWLNSEDRYLDLVERLNIAVDIVAALEYLHHDLTSAIVHCDLKPSNILLDDDKVAYLCDFGIDKLFNEGESMKQTKTLGTIGYMAPGNILDFHQSIHQGVHVTLDTLLKDNDLVTVIKGLVQGSGGSYTADEEVEKYKEKAAIPESQQLAEEKQQEKVSLANKVNGISTKESVAVL